MFNLFQNSKFLSERWILTKFIGVRQNMISDKGRGVVSQFLNFSDKGGRGGKPISDFWLTRGGGKVWTPPFLADIICEQPL